MPSEVLYEFGAYGMPGRFSHWTHGKMYQLQKTMYDYGLSKIYELVINNDPCYAYLMRSNSITASGSASCRRSLAAPRRWMA